MPELCHSGHLAPRDEGPGSKGDRVTAMYKIDGVPHIDTSVEYVGTTRLRKLNAANLRAVNKTLVVQENDTPLAVLLKYEKFLTMQNKLEVALRTVELLSQKADSQTVVEAVRDATGGGNSIPLS